MKGSMAIVPMKARSERVKDKNIREVAGVPLFYHILRTLMKCRNVSEIYVDTDSDQIKEYIQRDFKDIGIIDRPAYLAEPNVPMNDVIAYDLSQIKGDFFLQTHATNPLLKSETIDQAIDCFRSQEEHDSLFSVTKMQKRFYDSQGDPINHDVKVLLDTQNLEPIYEENSCIYIFTRRSFEQHNNRIGENPMMYEIDKAEAIDIDDEFEFLLVKSLMESKTITG
jgi:CMP-N-acetylneuraminic acid synthetase